MGIECTASAILQGKFSLPRTRFSFIQIKKKGCKIGLVLLSLNEVRLGKMTIGGLTLLLSYQEMLHSPLSRLYDVHRNINDSAFKLVPLFKILVSPSGLASDVGKQMPPLNKSIQVCKVSFTYPNKIKEEDEDSEDGPGEPFRLVPCLKDISISIPSGKVVALCGFSGSGWINLSLNKYLFSLIFIQREINTPKTYLRDLLSK